MSYFRFSVGCGEEWTRTTELRRGQIYSLLQLPLCDFPIFMFPVVCLGFFRADEGTRTPDRLITNQLLYQLSYIGFFSFVKQLFFCFEAAKILLFFYPAKYFFSFSLSFFSIFSKSILFLIVNFLLISSFSIADLSFHHQNTPFLQCFSASEMSFFLYCSQFECDMLFSILSLHTFFFR